MPKPCINSILERARIRSENLAIIDNSGNHSYGALIEAAKAAGASILNGSNDLGQKRVAFMVPPSLEYVTSQWGIWLAGGVAVPLALMYPQPELEFIIDDSEPSLIIAHPDFSPILEPIARARSIPMMSSADLHSADRVQLPEIESSRRAMIVYTSGTTGKPKGVVSTHANIQAQTQTLIEAWEWTSDDHILSVLPLHHIHGIINVVTCSLFSGATCEFLPKFDPKVVWDRFAEGDLTLFMAVPTIYSTLIAAYHERPRDQQQGMTEGCAKMRVMISGSAALPVPTLQEWKEISGHVLLERYGMTEIGMALSNPLHGDRIPGCVGTPLPGVRVRRMNEDDTPAEPAQPAELQVKGASVFGEYWRHPTETQSAFCDGWFRTGDLMVVDGVNYRIFGRISVDIIKSGGYKISTLEIEETLGTHPAIKECAVIGVNDERWGERVCAAVVFNDNQTVPTDQLRAWGKERLAAYKVPTQFVTLDRLPRNVMGKLQKTRLKTQLQKSQDP